MKLRPLRVRVEDREWPGTEIKVQGDTLPVMRMSGPIGAIK